MRSALQRLRISASVSWSTMAEDDIYGSKGMLDFHEFIRDITSAEQLEERYGALLDSLVTHPIPIEYSTPPGWHLHTDNLRTNLACPAAHEPAQWPGPCAAVQCRGQPLLPFPCRTHRQLSSWCISWLLRRTSLCPSRLFASRGFCESPPNQPASLWCLEVASWLRTIQLHWGSCAANETCDVTDGSRSATCLYSFLTLSGARCAASLKNNIHVPWGGWEGGLGQLIVSTLFQWVCRRIVFNMWMKNTNEEGVESVTALATETQKRKVFIQPHLPSWKREFIDGAHSTGGLLHFPALLLKYHANKKTNLDYCNSIWRNFLWALAILS